MTVAGVLLAAGRSSRTGTSKALARLGGRSLAARAVDTLRAGGCSSIVVVVASPHARAIRAQLADVQLVENSEPERGMLSSLQLGLAASRAEAVVVSLVDHPFVRATTVAALIAAWRRDGGLILRPRFEDNSGHPILIAGEALASVREADPEGITREVLAAHVARDIPMADAGVLDDFDTRAELVAAGLRLPGDDADDPKD